MNSNEQNMKIEKIGIGKIKKNPKNPRLIRDAKFEKLVKSIQDFPQMLDIRPIVVNSEMIILGGNMRFEAAKKAGLKEVPIIIADKLSPEQQAEFIIKDNVGFGDWDWDILKSEWDEELLNDWGLDLPTYDNNEINQEDFSTDFNLPDGDKAPFQQMTFTLADEQATQIKNAIADIKKTDEYKYAETMGNENSNGNALYLIVMQWAEQRK